MLARSTYVLPLLNAALFGLNVLRNGRENQQFVREYPDFCVPPKNLAFDAYHSVNFAHYYRTGNEHARFVASLINDYSGVQEMRVYEWGCGPARLMRHLAKYLPDKKISLYGTDVNPKSVRWCQQHFPNMTFARNSSLPPVSFGDRFFDVIYAISVFTHLSGHGFISWLQELGRLLVTNGIIILTTHGQNFMEMMLPREKELFLKEQIVVRQQIAEGKKWYSTFHPKQFVQKSLPDNLHLAAHLENSPLSSQDVWVVRKKP